MTVKEMIAALAFAHPDDEIEIRDSISEYTGDVIAITRYPAHGDPAVVVITTKLES